MKRLFTLLVLVGSASAQLFPYPGPGMNGTVGVPLNCPLGPNYSCASTSTANPGNITALFTSTAATAGVCSGQCQNATAEDETIPGHIANTNVITRITDGSTVQASGIGGSVGNLSCSGGDNDRMISANGTYLGVSAGGGVKIYHLSMNTVTATGRKYLQVVNTGPPAIGVNCSFAFSWVTDTRFYYNNGSVLHQGDITSDSTFTDTTLVDLTAAGICPGYTSTVSAIGILGVSDDDDKFGGVLQAGAQETSDWTFVWSRTLGCATANWNTGQVWNYCKAPSTCNGSTTATGTFATGANNCWGSNGSAGKGVHDSQFSGDGLYQVPSHNNPWTQGGCSAAGQGSEAPGTYWQVGTTGNQNCGNRNIGSMTNIGCGSHESVGVSNTLNPGSNNSPTYGPNNRSNATISTFTVFFPVLIAPDAHCSWPHTNGSGSVSDDTLPWICTSAEALTGQGTVGVNGCTSAVYCPNYQVNSVFALYPSNPNAIVSFSHTFACALFTGTSYSQCTDGLQDPFGAGAAIGIVSPKGDYFCWASSMLHQMGLDNGGKPRVDAFCVVLQ